MALVFPTTTIDEVAVVKIFEGPALGTIESLNLLAPDGGIWALSVDNDGILQTTKVV